MGDKDDQKERNGLSSVVIDPGGGDQASFTFKRGIETTGSGEPECRVEAWFILEADLPVAATYTIRATTTGTVKELCMSVISIYDAKQETPEADQAAQDDTEPVPSISMSITTVTNDALVIDGAVCGDGGAGEEFSPDNGQTERVDFLFGGTVTACLNTLEVATAGATTIGVSHNNASPNRLVYVAVACAPLVGAAGPRLIGRSTLDLSSVGVKRGTGR